MDFERAVAAWLLLDDTEEPLALPLALPPPPPQFPPPLPLPLLPPPTCAWILCEDEIPMRWSIMEDGARLGVVGGWGWGGPPVPVFGLPSCEERGVLLLA